MTDETHGGAVEEAPEYTKVEVPPVPWGHFENDLSPYLDSPENYVDEIQRVVNNASLMTGASIIVDAHLEDTGLTTFFDTSDAFVYTAYATFDALASEICDPDVWGNLNDDAKTQIGALLGAMQARLLHEASLWIDENPDPEPPMMRGFDALYSLDTKTEWSDEESEDM